MNFPKLAESVFGASWKLRLVGVGGLLTVLGDALTMQFDENPATVANWGIVIAVMLANFGNVLSRQNNITSKQAGAES